MSHKTVRVDPERTAAICDAAFPATRKGLRRWLGAAAYLRAFIPGFSKISAPLTGEATKRGLLPKESNLLTAFAELKKAIEQTVTLHAPVDGRPFKLFVDASDYAVGAALLQDQEGQWVSIGYYSKKLTDVQSRWCATDRELFAILWALTSTAAIVLGARITLMTDHSALVHLDSTATPKLVRYGLAIRASGAKIEHVKGTNNVVADFL